MKNRDSKLRFSIRKLTIGAVSVMFGAVIFGVSANQVHADELNSDSQPKPETKSEKTTDSETPEKVVVTVNKADSSQSAAQPELAESKVKQNDTTEAAVNKKTDNQSATESQVKISNDDPTKPLPKGQGRLVVSYEYDDPAQGEKFEILKSEQYVGPIGSVVPAKQIKTHVPAGFYSLQQINVDNNPKYENIGDQVITKDVDIIETHPDGSKVTGIPTYFVRVAPFDTAHNEYKRTIHFMLEDGGQSNGAKTPDDIEQDVIVPLKETIDKNGDLAFNGDPATLPEVNIPEVPGYVTKEKFVPVKEIEQIIAKKLDHSYDFQGRTYHEDIYVNYYVANRERRVIYHDVTNDQDIKSDLLKGHVGYSVTYNLDLPDGYALAPEQGVPANLVPINIDNPDIVIKVVPLKSEHDTHRRVIHYWINKVGGKQAFSDAIQNAYFIRSQRLDDTYHAVWTPWNQAQVTFDEVKSPEMKGYTADKLSLPAKTIYAQNPEGALHTDEITNVVYTPNNESININYRDSESKKFIKIDNLKGKYGQTKEYQATLPNGYAFHRDQILPTSITFSEKNDPRTIWLDPLKSETNRYIRTIHYQYADGTKAADDYNLSFDFTRTQHVDKNGYAEWGAWNKDHIDAPDVVSPMITGYTPQKLEIPERVVTPGVGFDELVGPSGVPTLREEYTIVYNVNPETQRVLYRYVKTGQILSTETLNGHFDQTINIVQHIPTGYFKVAGQDIPSSVTLKEQNPDIIIYVDKLAKDAKTVHETIHYIYADGTKAADDKTAAIEFHRNQIVDEDGNVSWGAWDKPNDSFAAVVSPVIANYTADKPQVDAQNVVPTSSDIEITVTYSKKAQPTKPEQPTKPGQPTKPEQPTKAQPTKPDQPTKPEQPTKAQPTKPEQPSKPTNPDQVTNASQPTNAPVLPQEQPTTPANQGEENVRPHASDVPAAAEDKHGKTETVRPHAAKATGKATVKPLATKVRQHNSANKEELPQTGDKENEAGLLGLALASISLFGLITDRKRKN